MTDPSVEPGEEGREHRVPLDADAGRDLDRRRPRRQRLSIVARESGGAVMRMASGFDNNSFSVPIAWIFPP